MQQPYSEDPPNDAALARYLSGESALDERLDIERWMGRDPTRRTMIAYMSQAWEEPKHAVDTWDTEALLDRLVARRDTELAAPVTWTVHPSAGHSETAPGEQSPRATERSVTSASKILHTITPRTMHRSGRTWAPAAFVAMVAAFAIGVNIYKDTTGRSAPAAATTTGQDSWKFATAAGQRAVVTLVDGTTVTLGVSSRLAPAPGYGLGTREVVLEGEAYFDVVNDASAPFIVRTGSTVTRVLGTTFNVRKYPQDTTVQVAVAAGKVAIGNHNATTLLNVGDVGQVDAQGKSVVVHDPKLVDAEMQWRDGWLTIDNLTLRQAAVELSRWYDLDVRIASSALADRHITISFRNELPAAVVRSIAQVLNARAEWSGRQVTFFER